MSKITPIAIGLTAILELFPFTGERHLRDYAVDGDYSNVPTHQFKSKLDSGYYERRGAGRHLPIVHDGHGNWAIVRQEICLSRDEKYNYHSDCYNSENCCIVEVKKDFNNECDKWARAYEIHS